MNTWIVGSAVAVSSANIASDHALANRNNDGGAGRIPSVFVDHSEHDPMPAVGDDVPQQVRRPIPVDDNDVYATVVVNVAERGGPAGVDQKLGRSPTRSDLLEPPTG